MATLSTAAEIIGIVTPPLGPFVDVPFVQMIETVLGDVAGTTVATWDTFGLGGG